MVKILFTTEILSFLFIFVVVGGGVLNIIIAAVPGAPY